MQNRILLKKSKQKELIGDTKNKLRITWKQLSQILDINQGYLVNELYREKRTISKKIYKKLCCLIQKNYDKFILKELNANWGQIKGGKNVKHRSNLFKEKIPKILCPKSPELAELIGIILGDGSIYVVPKSSIYQISVAGNLITDKDYLINYVKPLFERIFSIKMCVKKSKNCLYVWKQSKDLAHTFNYYGVPNGNKKRNNVSIPKWILNNKIFLKRCLRGIVDTDGCVYPKNKTNMYPTIWISSAIPNLRKSITIACRKLQLNITEWKPHRNYACIQRKKDVFKYYKEIGFRNPKHLSRWTNFNKAPVV